MQLSGGLSVAPDDRWGRVRGLRAHRARHGAGAPDEALQVPGGRRKWRVPVRGSIVTNNARFYLAMAERGMGLVYGGEIGMKDRLDDGRLVAVLEDYAPTEQGIFLCFPKRDQQSPAQRHLVSVAKEVLRVH